MHSVWSHSECAKESFWHRSSYNYSILLNVLRIFQFNIKTAKNKEKNPYETTDNRPLKTSLPRIGLYTCTVAQGTCWCILRKKKLYKDLFPMGIQIGNSDVRGIPLLYIEVTLVLMHILNCHAESVCLQAGCLPVKQTKLHVFSIRIRGAWFV